jgi:hypothetical protein
MSKIVKASDLTKQEGDPTERAVLGRVLEKVRFRGSIFGSIVEVDGEALPGSDQSTATTTFLLVLASCFVIGTASAIGVPPMAALIAGLSAPICIYVLVRVIIGRWAK